MKRGYILAFSLLVLAAGAGAQQPLSQPKSAREWFALANERVNIRMPGAPAFQMKIRFTALPGEEFLPPEQSEILTGEGVYEETWVAPHQWRREVSLGSYHAVEVESEEGRKLQTSSAHEPSRVLMLLDAVLTPVPRNLVSREFREGGASGWLVAKLSDQTPPLIRLNTNQQFGGATAADSYYLLRTGAPVLRQVRSVATSWEELAAFGDKVVPRRIVIRTETRILLTAAVETSRLQQQPEPARFHLGGRLATPGETLRRLQLFEIGKFPEMTTPLPTWSGDDRAIAEMTGVLDPDGRYREVELLTGRNAPKKEYKNLLADLREARWKPARIDESPCEFLMPGTWARQVFVNVRGSSSAGW